MALKKDERQYKIKTLGSNVPYVPAKSYASIAVDAFKPTLQRLQNDAANTAQANYFQNFQIQTRDQFDKFRNEFENDPDGMRNAVDAYSKTLLEKTPAPYKIQANAMLASYSQNSILYAAGNKRKIDENKLFGDRETNWQNANTESEFGMANFNEQKLDLAIKGINSQFQNSILAYNELGHDDYENLVKTGKLKDKDHLNNIKENTKDLLVARGFHIMKSLSNNNQEKGALDYLKDFMNGEDKYDVFMVDENFKNNAMYKIVRGLFEDDDSRQEIVEKILTKYKFFNNETIYGKSKKPVVNLDFFKEPGQALSIEQFKGGAVNVNDIIPQIPNLEIGSTKANDLIRYVSEMNRIQKIVSTTMQNENKVYNFDSDEDKELWAKAVLANNGIHKIQFSDINSDSFQIAINLLAKQDYFPDKLNSYLTINDAASFTDEGSINYFKEQAQMYQYLSNDELFPDIDYSPLYQKAIDYGILEADLERSKSIMTSIQNENFDKKIENINAQFDDNNASFEYMFNAQIKSPHFLPKLFADKNDPLHKSLFPAGDQTTWIAYEPKEIIPPEAMATFKGMWFNEMAMMTTGENPDIWSKQNTGLRDKAFKKVLKRMSNEGWGIETNTMDGKPKLVKNPFWHQYGSLNNNDVYAAINEDFNSLSKEEQFSKYGTNKLNEVMDNFKQWADDKNGNVKMSIDRLNYKDQSGKHAYKLSMHIGDEMITMENNFKPNAFVNLSDKEALSSAGQVLNYTTNKIYENFKKSTWYDKLPDDKKHWTKRAVYSIIRNGLKLSDYRFYPDIPGINDVPAEIRPFAWIARTLGFKGDLREIRTELQIAANTANENLSYQKKINLNRNLTDKEKITESLLPPEKTVMSENAMDLNFKQWALDNYQNEELRLTHRTNNWGSISSDGWEGELDINYQRDSRKIAIFGHPKDSIRAISKLFLNHSTLTENINGDKIPSEYGSEPTIEEMLTKTKYATDMKSYMDALDAHPTLNRDTRIDLMNANEMHKFITFIVHHEMGKDYFIEKFGLNNPYVDSVIFTGFNQAIDSYNGELGRL